MRAEAVTGQLPAIGLVVGDDDRLDVAVGQGGDHREADRPRADDDGDLTLLDICRADVELADGERIGQRDGIAGDIARYQLGRHFRNHQQFTETPLRFGVLTDGPHTAGAAVDQAHRHRRHP
jgi:hypothetical protein